MHRVSVFYKFCNFNMFLAADLRTMHQYNKEGTIISPRDRGKSAEPSLAKENLNLSNEIKSAGEIHTRLGKSVVIHCVNMTALNLNFCHLSR